MAEKHKILHELIWLANIEESVITKVKQNNQFLKLFFMYFQVNIPTCRSREVPLWALL